MQEDPMGSQKDESDECSLQTRSLHLWHLEFVDVQLLNLLLDSY